MSTLREQLDDALSSLIESDEQIAELSNRLSERDAEIARLRGALDDAEQSATYWERSRNDWKAAYEQAREQLAVERQRAPLPEALVAELRAFRNGFDGDPYPLLCDILAWHEQGEQQ